MRVVQLRALSLCMRHVDKLIEELDGSTLADRLRYVYDELAYIYYELSK